MSFSRLRTPFHTLSCVVKSHLEGGSLMKKARKAAVAPGDVDDLIFSQESNWLTSDR